MEYIIDYLRHENFDYKNNKAGKKLSQSRYHLENTFMSCSFEFQYYLSKKSLFPYLIFPI